MPQKLYNIVLQMFIMDFDDFLMEGMLYVLIDLSERVLQVIFKVSCLAWLLCHHYYQWGVKMAIFKH